MGDRPRATRTTVLALVVAIAGTGVVGYLISRPAPVPTVPGAPPQSGAPPTTLPIPTAQPSAVGFSVAADPVTDQVVIFGGSSGTGGDTWTWNGLDWSYEDPVTQPPPLSEASAVYDPLLRMVMLAGGGPFDAGGNDGTWGWDGKTWHELDSDTTQPPVAGGTLAWDPALEAMFLVTPASATDSSSSQTWLWNDDRWIPKGAPAPFQATALQMGFDDSLNALVAVSCCVDLQASTNTAARQTWRWDGSAWRLLGPTAMLPTPTFFGVGWDSITHSMLMCGQVSIGPQAPQLMPALMWKLVGHQWIALPGTGPAVSSAVLIETDDGLQLIGADSTVEGTTTPYHIWAWTGAGWKQLG